MVTVEVLD